MAAAGAKEPETPPVAAPAASRLNTDDAPVNTDDAHVCSVRGRMHKIGLIGEQPTSVWVGNIPESSANETAIRFLFRSCGDIRRVYLRKKQPPASSWCLLMFRESVAAMAAMNSPPVVLVPSVGEQSLLVELPDVERQLAKAHPGALGTVLAQALGDDGGGGPRASVDDDDDNAGPEGAMAPQQEGSLDSGAASPRAMLRRRSLTELAVRGSLSAGDDDGAGGTSGENAAALSTGTKHCCCNHRHCVR
jgi:hypothetical protein